MFRFTLLSISLLALMGSSKCGDDGGTPPDAGGGGGGIDAPPGTPPDNGDTGIGGATGEVAPIGFAVVNSDFQSSSVSLLDGDAKVVKGDCFTSGTQAPGATLALSGDVVLPSWAQSGNEVVAIDRTNSALTWLDPTTCAPRRQLDVSTGFFANPHDVVSVAANKAYVLRSELNKAPGKKAFDAGDDLLIIDPSKPAITGRIDLAPLAVQITGGPKIQARPDRARRIGDKLYVALSNSSADFMTASHGRIVIVDIATDTVSGMIDIPDLNNCSNLSFVEQTKTLIVACNGSFSAPSQVAVSGIVSIDTTTNTVSKTQVATPFGNLPVFTYEGIAKAGAVGFAVTSGDFAAHADQLWRFDTAAATATPISTATDSFVYGTVLVDPVHERVFLTDATATAPHLLVFSYTNTATTAETPITTSPTAGLPPREFQRR